MQPIERPKSLANSVVERLRLSIVQGDLALGQPLSERQLAETLGVSKTPVREALAQLRVEGLVHILPQRGAVVFTLSAREVINMCELRLTLESAALRFAFERSPNQLIDGLHHCVHVMETARSAKDGRGYLDADTAFHQVFFAACGNPMLADAYEMHVGKIAAVRTHLAVKPLHTERSFQEHREILELLRKQNIDGTLTVLDRHVERTKTTYGETVEDIAAADNSNEAVA